MLFKNTYSKKRKILFLKFCKNIYHTIIFIKIHKIKPQRCYLIHFYLHNNRYNVYKTFQKYKNNLCSNIILKRIILVQFTILI